MGAGSEQFGLARVSECVPCGLQTGEIPVRPGIPGIPGIPGGFVGEPQYVTFGSVRNFVAVSATWDCLPAYRQFLRMKLGGAVVPWEPSDS